MLCVGVVANITHDMGEGTFDYKKAIDAVSRGPNHNCCYIFAFSEIKNIIMIFINMVQLRVCVWTRAIVRVCERMSRYVCMLRFRVCG